MIDFAREQRQAEYDDSKRRQDHRRTGVQHAVEDPQQHCELQHGRPHVVEADEQPADLHEVGRVERGDGGDAGAGAVSPLDGPLHRLGEDQEADGGHDAQLRLEHPEARVAVEEHAQHHGHVDAHEQQQQPRHGAPTRVHGGRQQLEQQHGDAAGAERGAEAEAAAAHDGAPLGAPDGGQQAAARRAHHSSKDEKDSVREEYDETSYKEELQKYIAESSANLRYVDDEPLDSSDEDTSDEDSDPVSISPRNAEIFDFSESIVSISSDKTEEYVVPPVKVPRSYRTQDRQGGVLVAGHQVLFTNWAFKRQLRHMGRLGPLPERGEADIPSIDEVDDISVGFYSGKIVEL
ncbi:unnamed protein product [Phytophthora lilii]|uniref:Unnamed protein product n=1 Tax=Phytophthora lilii TaxID=2077276 RepID=A0A9W6YIU1_9STRA|nr:unnamed protein product [Phytophthora lilii]